MNGDCRDCGHPCHQKPCNIVELYGNGPCRCLLQSSLEPCDYCGEPSIVWRSTGQACGPHHEKLVLRVRPDDT